MFCAVTFDGIGDGKCTADVDAAFARVESGLALGGAQTHERAGSERKPPLRVAHAQELKRLNGKRARLVESALRVFGAVKRNWDNQHFGGSLAGELRDCIGHQAAQLASGGVQAIVFESVDGVTHATLVDAVGDSTDKWRRGESAGAAKR